MTDFPWRLALEPLVLSPFIGSFAGVLIRRLPAGRPVAAARSACESCGTRLGLLDLAPLLSYAALRGRCRHCGRAIAAFHWHVELAAVAVAVWAVLADPAGAWANCALGWTLLALAWIDAISFRLPDLLTLPLIPAGLALAWWDDPAVATDHAWAAAAGFAVFRGVALAYRRLRNRDGLGEGDAKLLAALGAWTGLAGLAPVVLGAALAGLLAALAMRLRGQAIGAATAIPFGPCLALAGWLVRLYL